MKANRTVIWTCVISLFLLVGCSGQSESQQRLQGGERFLVGVLERLELRAHVAERVDFGLRPVPVLFDGRGRRLGTFALAARAGLDVGRAVVECLLVGGVTTSMCVETSVRDAAQRDYKTFLVRDACADYWQERHDASLAALEFGFARVISHNEAIAAIAGGKADF